MYKNKTFLAIIPARGGSKGLPGKNIKELRGKPLIAWNIEAGLESKYLDEVMVTTDYQNIADVSKQYGASVPFLRPDELASDTATSFDAIKHTIEYYKNQDLEKYYRINGTIYICKTDRLLAEKSFFIEDNIFAYVMDRNSSIDIDEEIDFKMAEILFEEIKSKYEDAE